MGTRLQLHAELIKFIKLAYFQPPASLQLKYPCIVYHKSTSPKRYGNDKVYSKNQGYQLTIIETNPDSEIADQVEEYFDYCTITQRYVVDSLHHTTLNLNY